MTLYKPTVNTCCAEELVDFFGCKQPVKDEVLHYARVLAARGMPEDYIILAVSKYAKLRRMYEGEEYA